MCSSGLCRRCVYDLPEDTKRKPIPFMPAVQASEPPKRRYTTKDNFHIYCTVCNMPTSIEKELREENHYAWCSLHPNAKLAEIPKKEETPARFAQPRITFYEGNSFSVSTEDKHIVISKVMIPNEELEELIYGLLSIYPEENRGRMIKSLEKLNLLPYRVSQEPIYSFKGKSFKIRFILHKFIEISGTHPTSLESTKTTVWKSDLLNLIDHIIYQYKKSRFPRRFPR